MPSSDVGIVHRFQVDRVFLRSLKPVHSLDSYAPVLIVQSVSIGLLALYYSEV